ncbi:hypothetical protein QBZ16_002210 [Prototheca wickerhamii]|uniref:Uncharacterized protein n=1 Tax=Prototheca wickerhamii TaxID=3111 RepID=A0AAD9MLJ3_PROWI|nr:hypothetical protein QBZ16_002210 [Prototheca wickerhamii]
MLGSGLALVRATSRRTPRSLLVPSGDALRLCPMYSTDSDAPTTTGNVFVYTSPYGPTVRRVKKLSLFSCACAVGAGPVILGLDSGMGLPAKLSLTATLASFGVFTTGLLHWFVTPYVQRMEVNRATGDVTAEVLTLFGGSRQRTFNLADAQPTEGYNPLTTFQARGSAYYVDPAHFSDKEILARLAPEPAAEDGK